MNFFGHAAVAAWRSDDPGFALGAMLPDFAAMVGARPPEVEHPSLARGVALHHETDHAFHESRGFHGLEMAARKSLAERGLRRGSALAVAHVGLEIILDGVIARERAARDAYVRAVDAARPKALGGFIRWRSLGERWRFRILRVALEERGAPTPPFPPQVIAHRIERALAARPRLALGPGDERVVERWVDDVAPEVEGRADAILEEVRRGLDRGSPS